MDWSLNMGLNPGQRLKCSTEQYRQVLNPLNQMKA